MKMTAFMTLFRPIAFLTSLLLLATASPVPVSASPRDVWTPRVLYPNASTVWNVGERHNVTWDTSNPPQQITNGKGKIVLRNSAGFIASNYSSPLVEGFAITDGRVEITVPTVPTGSDYQIVLFGDSGNVGEEFTINN